MLAPQEIRTFFITAVTANRRSLFQVDENAQLFLDILREDQAKGRYAVHAFVIMRDHVHLLLTPTPAISLEKAMQFIKGGFSFRLKSKLDVWERSFKEHRIKSTLDYQNHVRYIEENPVRAGYAQEPSQWIWSSALQKELVQPAPVHLMEQLRG